MVNSGCLFHIILLSFKYLEMDFKKVCSNTFPDEADQPFVSKVLPTSHEDKDNIKLFPADREFIQLSFNSCR